MACKGRDESICWCSTRRTIYRSDAKTFCWANGKCVRKTDGQQTVKHPRQQEEIAVQIARSFAYTLGLRRRWSAHARHDIRASPLISRQSLGRDSADGPSQPQNERTNERESQINTRAKATTTTRGAMDRTSHRQPEITNRSHPAIQHTHTYKTKASASERERERQMNVLTYTIRLLLAVITYSGVCVIIAPLHIIFRF